MESLKSAIKNQENLLNQDPASNSFKAFANSLKLINDIRKSDESIDLVLIGAIALSCYTKGRYTSDLDFLAKESDRPKIINYLINNDIKYSIFGQGSHICVHSNINTLKKEKIIVDIDILLMFTEVQFTVINTALDIQIFQVLTKVASPIGVMYMYLISDQPKHKIDATSLKKSEMFNIKDFYKTVDSEDELDGHLLRKDFKNLEKYDNHSEYGYSKIALGLKQNQEKKKLT